VRRNRLSLLISGTALAVFICTMVGLGAYPQSRAIAADRGSQVRENTKSAVVMMRLLCGTEIEYYENSGKREFGTVADLFRHDLIDADLADALGCPRMVSAKGKTCRGTHAPLHGYLYRLELVPSSSGGTPGFRIVGVPAVPKGEAQTGRCTFYVDQTQVIRASGDMSVEAGSNSPPLGTPDAPAID
jgi:hypothetical protein